MTNPQNFNYIFIILIGSVFSWVWIVCGIDCDNGEEYSEEMEGINWLSEDFIINN